MPWRVSARSKFNAQRTTLYGVTFDSKAEARHYADLRLRQSMGEFVRVELQPRFDLAVNGVKVCEYRGDFLTVRPDGEVEVIDLKGYKTQTYRLKSRLFEACYGFKISEVR